MPRAGPIPLQHSPYIRPTSVPVALNGFALWIALMVGLTISNYGFPILQLALRTDTSVPAVYVGIR